jgi:hypothetical protein
VGGVGRVVVGGCVVVGAAGGSVVVGASVVVTAGAEVVVVSAGGTVVVVVVSDPPQPTSARPSANTVTIATINGPVDFRIGISSPRGRRVVVYPEGGPMETPTLAGISRQSHNL